MRTFPLPPQPNLKLCLLLSHLIYTSFIVLMPHPARAANPLSMEVSSPLALTEKPLSVQTRWGHWFPIAVTLSNTGDAVQGTLTLRLTSSNYEVGPTSDFYTEVDLPANASRKRIWLYGRIERAELDGAEVRFQGRGFKPLKASMELRQKDPGTRIVLVVDDFEEKLPTLLSFRKPALGLADELKQNQDQVPDSNRAYVRPLGASHEMVPDRWAGLDSCDMVVLNDFSHRALKEEQMQAVRGYVASGGSLLIFGGANWQRLAQSQLSDLWPIVPTTSGVATRQDLIELVHRGNIKEPLTGADRLGGAPVLVTRGTVRPRARVRAGATSPLLVTNDVGAGRVVFLAVDPTKPPFLGWRGNEHLWADIFNTTARPSRIETVDPKLQNFFYQGQNNQRYGYGFDNEQQASGPTGALLDVLGKIPQLKTPPVSAIAWFLALYVFFLVPVNYCVLRYFDKRELAWVTVPVIVLVFSVMSYAAALHIKGSTLIVRQVNIVQGTSESGTARADAMLWLFSPRKTSYSITSAEPEMIVGDYILAKEEVTPSVVIHEPQVGHALEVQQAAINMWDWRAFVGQSVVNVGRGVAVRMNGKRPVITNGTPFNLRAVVLVTGSKVRGYGSIKAAASTSTPTYSDNLKLTDPQDVGRILRAAKLESLFPATSRDATGNESMRNTAQAALTSALGSQFGKNSSGGLLIAWSDIPAAALTVKDASPSSRAVTLFVFRLTDPALTHSVAAGSSAASAGNALAQRAATVSLVGFESLEANPDSISGSIQTYDCDLGAWGQNGRGRWSKLSLRVRGGGWNPNAYDPYEARLLYQRRTRYRGGNRSQSYDYSTRVKKGQKPAQLEVWDFTHNRWRPLQGEGSGQRSGSGMWEFKTGLGGATVSDLVRQPDNLVRLRIRTGRAAVQVNSLQVQATAAPAGGQ